MGIEFPPWCVSHSYVIRVSRWGSESYVWEQSIIYGEGVIYIYGNRESDMGRESYVWEQSIRHWERVIPTGTEFPPWGGSHMYGKEYHTWGGSNS